MDQLVQLGGAVLVLAAFALQQGGRLDGRSRTYLALNLVGSGLLAFEAAVGRQWGFLLLEGVWAAVSAWSLVAVMRTGRTAEDAAH